MAYIDDYTTLAALKSRLRITDTVDDTLLSAHISAASRAVDGFCNRVFGKTAGDEVREFDFGPAEDGNLRPSSRVYIIDDVISVTSVAVDEDHDESYGFALDSDDWYLIPRNAGSYSRPHTGIIRIRESASRWEGPVQITGTWGWPAVPDEVAEATLIQSARLYRRSDAPLGVVGTGEAVQRIASLDPDMKVLLHHLRRHP